MNENAMPHEIEPELLRPPPRALKRRGFAGTGLIFLRLFIMPHTIVGVGLMLSAIASTLVFFVGTNVPAQITARNVSHGKNTSYKLSYQYREAGAFRSGSKDVSRADYDATPVGAAVQVRRLPSLTNAQLVMPSGNRYPNPLLLWGPALFWNGIVSMFLYMAWVAPWQRKAVLARGIPVEGRITDKSISRGRNTSYTLCYAYAPREYSQSSSEPFSFATSSAFESAPVSASATPLQSTMNVSKADYETAQQGDFVTVLYDAQKPKRSLIYRYAEYQCAD